VIRFTNEDVLKDVAGVCERLGEWIPPQPPLKKGGVGSKTPHPVVQGMECHIATYWNYT